MIYLHKILPMLVSPLAIALALIVYGAVTSRKKVIYAAIAALYVLSTRVRHQIAFSPFSKIFISIKSVT